MAQNKEKIIAKMACISVIFNVVCALVAVIVFSYRLYLCHCFYDVGILGIFFFMCFLRQEEFK